MISIVDPGIDGTTLRPVSIPADNHLVLDFADDALNTSLRGPDMDDINRIIAWLRGLDRDAVTGLLVHCYAGVSRSPAVALLALIVLEPELSMQECLAEVEQAAVSHAVWPNDTVVGLVDERLGCCGAFEQAVQDWKDAQADF